MTVSKQLQVILRELGTGIRSCTEGEWTRLENLILDSSRIFLYGQGRSGLAVRAFANRLGHLGKDAHFIGEITCPPVRKGDLVIAGSASGSSAALLAMIERAASLQADTALLTVKPDSPAARKSTVVCQLPGQAKGETAGSAQPMGALFEQLLWLSLDALVLDLMEKTGQQDGDLHRRHANLEA